MKGAFFLILVIIYGCAFDKDDHLPSELKFKDNVTVYQDSNDLKANIEFRFDKSFGGSRSSPIIGSLGNITVDKRETVYITDTELNKIHVFNSDGELEESIGREGDGPGEFRNVALLSNSESQLYVSDGQLNRMTLYTLETLSYEYSFGLFPDDIGMPNDFDDSVLYNFSPLNDSTILAGFFQPFRTDEPERTIRYYMMNSNGKIVSDEVIRQKDRKYLTRQKEGEPQISIASPFHGKPLLDLTDDHIYMLNTKHFFVKIYDLDGNYERGFYYDFHRKTLSREDAINYPEDRIDTEIFEELVYSVVLPETWPALNDLLVDDKNRLWVSTIVEDFDIYEWWVLEENGELITKFEWPRDEPIEVLKNEYMYTRETDEETGLQQVVRYRIEMEESGRE